MKKKKKGNLSDSILGVSILIVVFTASIAVLFMLSTKESKENNNSNEANVNNIEINANSYKEYINNIEKNINKYFKKNPYENRFANNNYYVDNGGYRLGINKNLELIVDNANGEYSSVLADEYKIADNVVSYFRVHTGNGSFHTIYYIDKTGILQQTKFIK